MDSILFFKLFFQIIPTLPFYFILFDPYPNIEKMFSLITISFFVLKDYLF